MQTSNALDCSIRWPLRRRNGWSWKFCARNWPGAKDLRLESDDIDRIKIVIATSESYEAIQSFSR